jgi:DNA-binding response OmpR family regulator
MDGGHICRRIRKHPDATVARVPVVMITAAQQEEHDIAAGFEWGVTDYLLKPMKASYVRARVRGWLLRAHAGSST